MISNNGITLTILAPQGKTPNLLFIRHPLCLPMSVDLVRHNQQVDHVKQPNTKQQSDFRQCLVKSKDIYYTNNINWQINVPYIKTEKSTIYMAMTELPPMGHG